MVVVPPFLLKRLYLKQSLRNNSQGFQFTLYNTLGSGFGTEIMPLTLDGQELPRESASFILNGEETPFLAVNKEKPFTLTMNKRTTIMVKGVTLSEGPHKVGFYFVAQGLGKLGFEVTDVVSNT